MFSDHPTKECCWRRLLAVVPLAAKVEVRELKGFSSARLGLGEPAEHRVPPWGRAFRLKTRVVSVERLCVSTPSPIEPCAGTDRGKGVRHSVGTD
jgi:hypothetical protein